MRIRVAAASELADRTASKFLFEIGGYTESGILARHDGAVVAYLNRCRHRPLPLDWDDGEFYDADGELLVCRSHGAMYAPATGLCVAGPCAGASLQAMAVSVEGDDVYVEIPIAADP